MICIRLVFRNNSAEMKCQLVWQHGSGPGINQCEMIWKVLWLPVAIGGLVNVLNEITA